MRSHRRRELGRIGLVAVIAAGCANSPPDVPDLSPNNSAVITVHGASSNATTVGSTTLVITKPTGVIAGDVLIAGVAGRDTAITAPAGWTQIVSANDGGTSATLVQSVFYKVASASE